MKHVTTLLHARWVIPVEPSGLVLDHHSIAIEDGRIVALLPSNEARNQFTAEQIVELGEQVLIPGFINAHTEIRGEFLAIDTALDRLQPGDLCLILIDQIDEALAHIAARVSAA